MGLEIVCPLTANKLSLYKVHSPVALKACQKTLQGEQLLSVL